MDHDDFARLVAMRVSVFLSRPAASGPARMTDAVITVQRVKPDSLLEIAEFALGAAERQGTILIYHRDPGRIITAIFKLAKPVDDQRHNLFISYVSYNSTHIIYILYQYSL